MSDREEDLFRRLVKMQLPMAPDTVDPSELEDEGTEEQEDSWSSIREELRTEMERRLALELEQEQAEERAQETQAKKVADSIPGSGGGSPDQD